MLKHLYIRNFTLIDELDIKFNPGFSVITGETGAGKSIILGAIGLLLGNRADIKQIRLGREKCIIEAHFDLSKYNMDAFFNHNDIEKDMEDTIIRRELTASGKSRAFINDTPVQLALMRELGEQLVDVHSQHQNLLLQKEDFQLSVVDIIGKDKQAIENYRKEYIKYHQLVKQAEDTKNEIEKNKKNEEFLRFQLKEIDNVKMEVGDQEKLEKEYERLAHAEEIKSALYETNNLLTEEDNNVVENVKQAAMQLQNIKEVYADCKELSQRLESSYIELKDIASEVNNIMDSFEFDPQRQEEINTTLDSIYALEQKFHVSSIAELIQIKKQIAMQIDHIDNSDDVLRELEKKTKAQETICRNKAAVLSGIRTTAARKIEIEMSKRLIPLGIPNVHFQIQITTKQLSDNGCDKISFLFSANKSTPMRPISQVASGGEIARVMLSLKAMISGAVKLPTIIFDEIDTGVSGKIAEKMAQIMQEMGNNHRQVISITHLPQIAALGSSHYKVFKEETAEGTVSYMKLLTDEERIREIAQMLSGSNITQAAMQNARELLKPILKN
ncbi:MAG TPA: DNA repair protein RecN [Prevotella sp.]|nr:DNA repair protein RecN [Prevotella sp.]